MNGKNEISQNEQNEIKEELGIENEREVKNGKAILTLKAPIKFNEVEIKDITLDFNILKGIDICEAESEALGKFYTPLPDSNYSIAYQGAIAAKAGGIPFEAILELKSKDFKRVTECTKGFLLG